MMKKLNLLFESLVFLLFIVLMVFLAVGHNFNYAVLDGINLWIACVLPALFPYFFITAILTSLKITSKFSTLLFPLTKRIFNTGGITGFAYFISILSGYPLGAKMVGDLKKQELISDTEAIRASAFCSTSSPMFLIGSVGNIMFRSNRFGIFLFLTHLLSSLLVGFIFSFYKRKDKFNKTTLPLYQKSIDNILYESVYSSVISVLIVGGLITVFYLLTEVFLYLKILNPLIELVTLLTKDKTLAESFVLGLFECTRALKTLSLAKSSLFILPVASAICGFGGLSVIAQSISYLKNAKIKTAPFILSKIISAVINFFVGLIFSLFL